MAAYCCRSPAPDPTPHQFLPDRIDRHDDARLIVDDDASIRGLLAEVVKREGGTPVLAASGLEGYASLTALSSKISMVLLDLTMPEMDGFAFRDLQLDDPELAEIPTVVLTGHALTADQLSFMRPAAVLNKPAPLAEIRRTIREFAHHSTVAVRAAGL